MTYQETLDFLFKQLPMYQREGKSAFKKDLTNIIAVCNELGNPEKKIKTVHIAGTNGKGSTAHMLSSIFQEAGYKTGLYTSPHLKDFRERIKINGELISENEVVSFVQNYTPLFAKIQPSFFEWTVALAFHYFEKEKVDVAIIETGLGGRLDSTNIISPELSIITNISLDHVDMLGNTLAEIAAEKAGIIKKGIPVIVGNHSGQRKVFETKAKAYNSPISFVSELQDKENYQSDLKGNYQVENIKTVLYSIQKLKELDWKISDKAIELGLRNVIKNTKLQGRWQVLQVKPKLILDTAHNEDGFSHTMKQLLQEEYQTLHLVIGFVKDKAIDKLLDLLPKPAQYYFCQAQIPRSLDAKELANQAQNKGLIGLTYPTVLEALNAAKKAANKKDVIYVGGSNFVVAEAL